jgi:transposase
MAGKTTSMNSIKQILRFHLEGASNRAIATVLGIDKETVNGYVLRAKADSMQIEELLILDDPVLEHRMKGGNPAYSDKRFETFKLMLPYFEQEMKHRHMTLQLLWDEYRSDHPDGYGLTQFRFHYNQHVKAQAQKPSTVVRDTYIPGQKLFIDFAGDTMSYIDIVTGEPVKVQMFVACMAVSDYGFAIGVPSQKSEDFIHAIICCFKSLGGVPHMLVPDNLKSAVVKTSPYEPAINNTLSDMANHYGCAVVPARPGSAKDKSPVEDQVKLVYRRVYAELRNEVFYTLEELNVAVTEKMLAHNRKRMQRLPYSREEHFLAVEKSALHPLPETDFEIITKTVLKAGMNGFIYLGREKHYYSIPHAYIGQDVKVNYTRTLVKVYSGGECIAIHHRSNNNGSYTMIQEHLASHSRVWRDKSPDYYIKRGQAAMPELGEVISCMFETATVPPETFYRGCDGLLHLEKNTAPELFRMACQTALQYRIYKYGFIKQLVESKCEGLADNDAQNNAVMPPAHSNIRGKDQFK